VKGSVLVPPAFRIRYGARVCKKRIVSHRLPVLDLIFSLPPSHEPISLTHSLSLSLWVVGGAAWSKGARRGGGGGGSSSGRNERNRKK